MIASTHFPAPGTEVGCVYRWPYDGNHPDCWQPPHKGVVLALDDPRAWRDTLAFPDTMHPNGPTQEAVTAHVQKCLDQNLLNTAAPVLWTSSIDGKQFIQWDSKLRPYAEELAAWEAARQAKRETLAKARLEYLRGELRAERISYGELAELQSLAPHIDRGDVELLEAAGVPESSE